MSSVSSLIKSYLNRYSNFQIGVNVDEKIDLDKLADFVEVNGMAENPFTSIHLQKPLDNEKMTNFIKHYDVRYNVIHIENLRACWGIIFGRKRQFAAA